jgi:hypothetical protein
MNPALGEHDYRLWPVRLVRGGGGHQRLSMGWRRRPVRRKGAEDNMGEDSAGARRRQRTVSSSGGGDGRNRREMGARQFDGFSGAGSFRIFIEYSLFLESLRSYVFQPNTHKVDQSRTVLLNS